MFREKVNLIHGVWIIPTLIVLIMSQFNVINIDSVRDYIVAYNLVVNGEVPLQGPQMASTFHLAPWWILLMALPLFISTAWSWMVLFVAVLSATKFYLAFRLGQHIKGKRFAILLVSSLMLISLTQMQQITFTHTNLVEACMLVVILASYKLDSNKMMTWIYFGLIVGFAFHAHPTAILAGYFLMIKWFAITKKIKSALCFLLGFMLIFSPVILVEVFADKEAVEGITSFFTEQSGTWRMFSIVELMSGVLMAGPWSIFKSLFSHPWAVTLMIIQSLFAVLGLLVGLPLIKKSATEWRDFALHSVVFTVLSLCVVVLIRNRTPWYMTYGLSLCFSLLISIGWFQISKLVKHFEKIILTVTLVMFLGVNFVTAYEIESNVMRQTSLLLFDVKSHDTTLGPRGYELTARFASAHGQYTCQLSPVSIHGPYAALIYSHSGVEHLGSCGNKGLYYGASDSVVHTIGVPKYFAAHIDEKPENIIGDTVFYQPSSIDDRQKLMPETFEYPYQKTGSYIKDWKDFLIQSELHSGKYLLVTKVASYSMLLEIDEVTVNGQVIEPVDSNVSSILYKCTDCGISGDNVWNVSFRESAQGLTDMVTF